MILTNMRKRPMGPKQSKSRVYVWPSESIIENLVNRRDRPHKEWKALLEEKMPGKVFRWSQKAGCGCGCSPGFVCGQYLGYDLHFDLVEEDASFVELAAR